MILRIKADRVTAAENSRLRVLADQRREEERFIAAEKQRQKEEERRKRDLLKAEALSWNQACQIRSYVAHLLEANNGESNPWLLWASNEADKIDPTLERLASFKNID
ncbi:hypothetical protein ACFQUU_02535 [Herbaspirillum sp. GCM10030257]|uniref:hypothetical protein n=1 Tax=Herbaspirillum sp. GCM10030257 TaxID=3273393 RepID=UPI00360EABEF